MSLCLGNKLMKVGLNGKIYYCQLLSTLKKYNTKEVDV